MKLLKILLSFLIFGLVCWTFAPDLITFLQNNPFDGRFSLTAEFFGYVFQIISRVVPIFMGLVFVIVSLLPGLSKRANAGCAGILGLYSFICIITILISAINVATQGGGFSFTQEQTIQLIALGIVSILSMVASTSFLGLFITSAAGLLSGIVFAGLSIYFLITFGDNSMTRILYIVLGGACSSFFVVNLLSKS